MTNIMTDVTLEVISICAHETTEDLLIWIRWPGIVLKI